MNSPALFFLAIPLFAAAPKIPDLAHPAPTLAAKAHSLQQNLIEKHLVDGLYVSIVPVTPPGTKLQHTVDEPGNVIHAGVWTGRYLAGVAYQYAVTKDPAIRKHGGDILIGLRRLQEVTGKPGLLARGYVKGHGPVEGYERDGNDSPKWHQGQGKNGGYRWYGDVSVDNFNAILYGYSVYYDIAADAAQKKMIAEDVDRLMTSLLDNHCRIIDIDGEVTRWGHVGVDPDPQFDAYYQKYYKSPDLWNPPLRASLMLLPDLLIANHITGKPRYLEFYKKVVARFAGNPDPVRRPREFSLEGVAFVDHSDEAQEYEAIDSLLRYEKDFTLSTKYRSWMRDLWEMTWMEGNPLFSFMTIDASKRAFIILAHRDESLALALDTLRRYPLDRVFHPVMNSLHTDIPLNPLPDLQGHKQSARPLPINQRPLDNEYAWKSTPYQLDGWLRPKVAGFQVAADDPEVAWFADSTGKIYMSRDGWKTWTDVSAGLLGARVQNIAASAKRTFVLYAQTDRGLFLTRDGGLSWRSTENAPGLTHIDFSEWRSQTPDSILKYRIRENQFEKSADDGADAIPAMRGWRIPRAESFFMTPRGVLVSGPGGAYVSRDGENWTEVKLWPEQETGAADYLHAYWMGRYFGLVQP
jgi:hypothetical protein